jgi:hypothetical protein
MYWNQPARVDYLRKKWKATQKKNSKKKGATRPCPGVDPWPSSDRWSPAGPGPTTWGRRSEGQLLYRVGLVLFFEYFEFFDASSYTLVNFLLEVWGMG